MSILRWSWDFVLGLGRNMFALKKMFQIKVVDFEEDHQMNYLDFEC